MSRPLRMEYPGAYYHVMNRGLARQAIFNSDKDRELFIELLCEIHNRYRVEIHAYCLMGNHYHILICTPLGNISRAMRHLNGVYTQRYNKRHRLDGPIYRGRYKSILVDADTYLLRLNRYIHLNPVVAGIVNKAEQYKWSSYKDYLSTRERPYWLVTTDTLAYFGERYQKKKYKLFVEEGIDKELDDYFKKLRRLPILGSEAFSKTVTEKYLKEAHKIKEIPEHKRCLYIPSMDEISQAVCHYYNVNETAIKTTNRLEGNLPRSVAIFLSYTIGQQKLQSIADNYQNLTDAGVSKICQRIRKRLQNSPELLMQIENIKEFLLTR